jgi:TatD DNase family protein
MPLKFFDAHTHANLAAFKDDYKEVINRALEKGVGLVNVGTQKDTSLRAVEIAHEFPDEPIFATIGLYPTHSHESDFHDVQELAASGGVPETFDYDFYRKLALDSKVVGIGECGLDYFRLGGNVEEKKKKQKEVFMEQIKLVHEVKKPLMIHCREAFTDLVEMLKTHRSQLDDSFPGIIHSFHGTKDDARKLLDLGFCFTFGGVITFPPKTGRRPDYEDIIKFLPLDRILSETDAPYVAPVPYRGKRNEPAYVMEVVKKLAELKSVSTESMADQILKNATIAFRIEIS